MRAGLTEAIRNYRHLPDLIRQGRVFVALPPLYRVDIGKETYLGRRRQ